MNSNTSPIDLSVIKGLIGDDEEVIKMFFIKFVDSVPGDMQEIKSALDADGYGLVKSLAHRLKSSAKAIGAEDFATLCQGLEDKSDLNKKEDLQSLYESLMGEFTRCRDYISEY